MGNQMVTWLMTSRDTRGQVVTPIRLESTIAKTARDAI